MPLITGLVRSVNPPPLFHWGEPKGRVRHVEVSSDGLSAVYVIEEAPGFVDYRYKCSGTEWSHKVWMPWRYFFINVRYDTRVEGGNAGYVFFASKRLGSMEDRDLLIAVLPNVFENGGICLGYHNAVYDRSPVRSAWRAVRTFYKIPGNQWLVHGTDMPTTIRDQPVDSSHVNHTSSSGGRVDYGCRWSLLSEDTAKSIYGQYSSAGLSPMGVLKSKEWRYQKGTTWDDESLSRVLREKGIEL